LRAVSSAPHTRSASLPTPSGKALGVSTEVIAEETDAAAEEATKSGAGAAEVDPLAGLDDDNLFDTPVEVTPPDEQVAAEDN
jgi:hypothetical protein